MRSGPVKLGLYLRNMGPASLPQTLVTCARAAEDAGVDELWVADHIAIAPDDAEGSGGRYLDPLATLAYLAGVTSRIALGTGVLVLPYRPALATAKWIATIQELSGGRLLFGVGVGWMEAEFRATGADRSRRGRTSDETLEFIHRCFAADEVEANGQPFLFKPRPPRPPIFVGGAPPHALARTVRYGEGWMPIGRDRRQLEADIAELAEIATRAGRPTPEVALITGLPLEDPARAVDEVHALAALGVTRIVHGLRYEHAAELARAAEVLGGEVAAALAGSA